MNRSLHLFLASLGLLTLSSVAGYTTPTTPRIIQGGMGVRISSWKLARAVSKKGELGVISGTAMDTVFIRALQSGDSDGAFRRALASFPDQDMAQRAMDKYYIEGGKDELKPFKHLPMWSTKPSQDLLEATILGNYCEVWLAKHDDDGAPTNGLCGMNLLTKVQLPTIPSLYGAMLADVDYILMGAGIPMAIPGILDNLAEGKDCTLHLDVEGILPEGIATPEMTFSPKGFWKAAGKPELAVELKRPNFLPIVSSVVLAQSMLKRASGKGPTKGVNGFVIELSTAGGHNAPPRGFRYDPLTKTHAADLNERGEPVYGPKDEVDLLKFLSAAQGLPFWLAGSYAKPDKFADVLELGGAGVQVGTAFALSQESGMRDEVRQEILKQIATGSDMDVYTDPVASPTGFPFKVLQLDGTLSQKEEYLARPRVCNLGYLRTAYVDQKTGKIQYRCASEPVDKYVKKGGAIEATEGRKCLCNALCADAGYPQVSPMRKENGETYVEQPLVTIGDDVNACRRFMKQDKETGRWSYSAGDVIDYLLSEWEARSAVADAVQKENVEDKEKAGVVSGGAGVATKTKVDTTLKP